jgi:hypothetical protein
MKTNLRKIIREELTVLSNFDKLINSFRSDFPQDLQNKVDSISLYVKNYVRENGFNIKFLNSCRTGFKGVRTNNFIIICSPMQIENIGDFLYTIFHEIRHEEQMGKLKIDNPLTGQLEDFEKLFHQIRLDYIFTVFKNLNPSSLNSFQNYLSVLKYEVPQNQFIFDTFTIKNERFYELSSQIINQIRKEKQTLIEIELNGDFYWDLCKSRAFKILIDNYTKLNDSPLNYLIVAKTSSQNPHQEKVNMLIQHTTEAISGFVSATDGIIIPPIQTENINFDRRMARNIFHLLHEESYLSLVDDASNGSYFIENYTKKIASKIYQTL